MGKLDGRVCLVAGASRGVGRGIAEGLGEAGATVYVTGRTTRRRGRIRGLKRSRTEGRPETIEETAERVTELGGEGIAVACDHTIEAEVVALFQRIQRERGRLDLLANNVWGGYERHDEAAWETPFWEIPIERWDLMMRTGLEGKWRTARLAAPLLLKSGAGLVVNISSPVGTPYQSHLPYYVVNHAVDRMTEAMAGDFRRYGVVVVSIQPGFTRTERVEEVYASDPAARKKDRVDETAHSPRYVGRAVAALAAAPSMERSGQVWPVGVLARELGFTDVDGRQPMWPPEEAGSSKSERPARGQRKPAAEAAPERRGRKKAEPEPRGRGKAEPVRRRREKAEPSPGPQPGRRGSKKKEAAPAAAPARRGRGKRRPAGEAAPERKGRGGSEPAARSEPPEPAEPAAAEKPAGRRRSRGRKRGKTAPGPGASGAAAAKEPAGGSRESKRPEPVKAGPTETPPEADAGSPANGPGQRRRRGRRGGRGRKGPGPASA